MNMDSMSINEVWEWLANHYGSLEDYLLALDDESEMVRQRLMDDAIVKKQKRWDEGILKLVEE